MAVLKDLIVHGNSRFLNTSYFNQLNTDKIGAEEGIFNKIVATTGDIGSLTVDDLTAGKATVLSLLDVRGELHTNQWTNSNIATIDGSFYITPTIGVPSGTMTTTANSVVINGSNFPISSLYVNGVNSDNTATTVAWTSGSKVLVTGEILVNGVYMPLGTLIGTLSANATASQIKVGSITDNRYQSAESLAEIGTQSTALPCRNVKISLYQTSRSSTLYPLGIFMTALGENGKTFLDIYGGGYATSTATAGGFAKPVLRIGNLAGLPTVGGSTPTGYGIYTSNGYFSGVIVSTSGKIANFTINGSKMYSNNHSAYNTAATGIYIGDDYISFGSGGVTYFNTSGTGKIGPWTLSTTYLRNGNITSATNTSVAGVYLGTDGLNISNGTAATTSYITKTAVNIGNKLTWNGTTLTIDGTASIGGTAASTVVSNAADGAAAKTGLDNLEIGGRNLLINTNDLTKWSKESGMTVVWNSTVNMYEVTTTKTSSRWGIYQDLDIKPNTTYTFSVNGMKSSDTVTSSAVGTFASSLSWPSTNTFTYTTDNTRSTVTFTSGADHVKCRIYLYLNPTSDNSKTGYFYRPKLEEGNKATDWSPAPEDLDVHKYVTDIDSNNGITIKPINTAGNDFLQMNSTAIEFFRNSTTNSVMRLTDSSFRLGLEASNHTTIDTNGLHIWSGTESTSTNEIALFSTTARIGKSNNSRFLMNATSLQAYNSSNQLYFEVSSNGMSYGTNTVATTAYADQAEANASYSLIVKTIAIDYAANTATLEATPYYQGSTTLPTGVTLAYQWYKDSVSNSSPDNRVGTNSNTLSVTNAMGLDHTYICVISSSN